MIRRYSILMLSPATKGLNDILDYIAKDSPENAKGSRRGLENYTLTGVSADSISCLSGLLNRDQGREVGSSR